MRNTLLLFVSIALTVVCWGMYGPVLQTGQAGMSTIPPQVARLRPFVCVGLAYFLIGVIVAGLWLHFRGEKGEWTFTGIIWSLRTDVHTSELQSRCLSSYAVFCQKRKR
jgi:hypothetical protein